MTTNRMTTAKLNGELDNSLGIPKANFVNDVEEFMKHEGNGGDANAVIRQLEENHTKYRFMEMNLVSKKKRLRNQVPDIKGSLDMIKLLKLKKNQTEDLDTKFLLSDQVYVKSTIKPKTESVLLWLGANVMLEYSLKEADLLLQKNLEIANRNLKQIDNDIDFVRDQITTTEVNMARIYNWEVQRRTSEKSTPNNAK